MTPEMEAGSRCGLVVSLFLLCECFADNTSMFCRKCMSRNDGRDGNAWSRSNDGSFAKFLHW
jgi:hypothetical protein